MFATLRVVACSLVVWTSLASAGLAQFGGNRTDGSSPSPAAEDAPAKPVVAMDVWIATLKSPRDVAEEDQLRPLLEEIANMPVQVGDRGEMRKRLDRWGEKGAIRRLETFRAATRSGQSVTLIRSDRVPQITGVSITQMGQTNSVQFQEFGTSLKLKPRVAGEHVIDVEIAYEDSALDESESVAISQPEKGDPIRALGTKIVTVQTTASVPNGAAVIVTLTSDSNQKSSRLVCIAAEFVEQ